jgi:hypothetical protein
MNIPASVAAALCCSFLSTALAAPGDPYEQATPDSRIVAKLMATPIPADVSQVNYVAPALEMLQQPSAQIFTNYLERSEWLGALGEPPLKAATVGEAIDAEKKAEPLNKVRSRAFAKIISVELAKPTDVLPERVRGNRERYKQVTPLVWDYVDSPGRSGGALEIRFLHVALTNTTKRDIVGFHTDLVLDATPPVTVQCQPEDATLKAGQRRVLFCGTDYQKKVPLQPVVDAAHAVADGTAKINVKPTLLVLHESPFNLQASGDQFYRRILPAIGTPDYAGRGQAADLVRASSCFERGTCGNFLAPMQKGGVGEVIWMGLGAGVVTFLLVAVFSLGRVRGKTMGIVTAVFAVVPMLVFAGLLGVPSMGMAVLLIPVLAGFAWCAWAVGFWGAWLLTLPLLRRKRGEVDDAAARNPT